MNFLRLRADQHAQYEIRAYANVIMSIVERWVPISYEAFHEYRLGAVTLSRTAIDVLTKLVKGESVDLTTSGLPPREWLELKEVFKLADPPGSSVGPTSVEG